MIIYHSDDDVHDVIVVVPGTCLFSLETKTSLNSLVILGFDLE